MEQVIRPTGLLDPIIEVRPAINRVDDLLEEIDRTIKTGDRVARYHSHETNGRGTLQVPHEPEHQLPPYPLGSGTLERVELLRDLRLGNFDVLVGINLLREGLDL